MYLWYKQLGLNSRIPKNLKELVVFGHKMKRPTKCRTVVLSQSGASIFAALCITLLLLLMDSFRCICTKYALLTKREVKIAGYWPRSFFAFFVEVHKNAKKERGQYPAILTEQAWSIKDLLYGFTIKLKLQQQNKTRHETALLGKKFFISRPVQDLFSVHFWISM